MKNLLFITLIWLALCSCVSRRIEVVPLGVMQLRTHRMTDHIDWETNTWVDKQEMCPPSGENCVVAKQLYYVISDGLLWVSVDAQRSPGATDAIYFFDTKTGTQIPCPKCKQVLKDWWISTGDWLGPDPRLIMFSGRRDGIGGSLIIAKIGKEVELTIVRRETTRPIKHADYWFGGISTSPDNSNLAWYECSPKCTLYWLNADYSGILSEATQCATNRLQIYWENGRPMNGHSAGTGPKIGCLDEKGAHRFPVLPLLINGVPVPAYEGK